MISFLTVYGTSADWPGNLPINCFVKLIYGVIISQFAQNTRGIVPVIQSKQVVLMLANRGIPTII